MLSFVENARWWSNEEIKRAIAPLSDLQSVINVSGYDDRDKQGGHYREYFPVSIDYFMTYYPTDEAKGKSEAFGKAFPVDLMETLPRKLEERFDLVFNHTVLEHVPNPFKGFEQIVKMSRDLVLTIVPFRQQLHFIQGSFGDYFRITPMGMRYLHQVNGLTTLYESTTPSPAGQIYVVSLATKHPEKHENYPAMVPDINDMNHRVGRHAFWDSVAHILNTPKRRIKRVFRGAK